METTTPQGPELILEDLIYSISKPVDAMVMAILSFSSNSSFSSYSGRSIRLDQVLKVAEK
jgi:hypothetical protein